VLERNFSVSNRIRGITKSSSDIGMFKRRKLSDDLVRAHTVGEHTDDRRYRDP
jgi:hypothetical protein